MSVSIEQISKTERLVIRITYDRPAGIRIRKAGEHGSSLIDVTGIECTIENLGNGYALTPNPMVTVNRTVNAYLDRGNDQLRNDVISHVRLFLKTNGLRQAPNIRDPRQH